MDSWYYDDDAVPTEIRGSRGLLAADGGDEICKWDSIQFGEH